MTYVFETSELESQGFGLSILSPSGSVPGHGWHPIDADDAYRLQDNTVFDHPDYMGRKGIHRPKFVFTGMHTKRRGLAVKNTIGCGCQEIHDAENKGCFYNIVRWYVDAKESSDMSFEQHGLTKLNKKQRLHHANAQGLRVINFFRSMPRGSDNSSCASHEIKSSRTFIGTWVRAPFAASSSTVVADTVPRRRTGTTSCTSIPPRS